MRKVGFGLRQQITTLRADDRTDEAAELQRKLVGMQRELELVARQQREQDRDRATERELRELTIQLEQRLAEGREGEAAELQREIEALARSLERRDLAR